MTAIGAGVKCGGERLSLPMIAASMMLRMTVGIVMGAVVIASALRGRMSRTRLWNAG